MTDNVQRLRSALSDRYRIERELGQGGMATVYLAPELRLERQVAIKVMRPDLAPDRRRTVHARDQDSRPAQHANVVAWSTPAKTTARVLRAPFVDGEPPGPASPEGPLQVPPVRSRPRWPPRSICHRHGIVHRDIKPENVMLHDGRLVADFGIALAISSAGATRMTGPAVARHAALHVARAGHGRARDYRALRRLRPRRGAHEMLVGEPPFTGPTAQAIIAKVLTEEPRPPTGAAEDGAPALEHAVLTALAKVPADRFGSAAEFAAALTAQGAAAEASRGPRPGPPALALAGVALGALILGAEESVRSSRAAAARAGRRLAPPSR